jgi:hypothetical protein
VVRTDYRGFIICVNVIVIFICGSSDRGEYRLQVI